MANQSKDKKSQTSPKSKPIRLKKIQDYEIVDNIPEGKELVIDSAVFTALFKTEIIEKLYKKKCM